MELILPILALIVGLTVLIKKIINDAKNKKCANCPFEKTCSNNIDNETEENMK